MIKVIGYKEEKRRWWLIDKSSFSNQEDMQMGIYIFGLAMMESEPKLIILFLFYFIFFSFLV